MKIVSFVHEGETVPPQLSVLLKKQFGECPVCPVLGNMVEWDEVVKSLEECCGDPDFCEDGDLLAELDDPSTLLTGPVRAGDVIIVPFGKSVPDFLVRRAIINTLSMVEEDGDLEGHFGGVRVFGHTEDRRLVQLYPKA